MRIPTSMWFKDKLYFLSILTFQEFLQAQLKSKAHFFVAIDLVVVWLFTSGDTSTSSTSSGCIEMVCINATVQYIPKPSYQIDLRKQTQLLSFAGLKMITGCIRTLLSRSQMFLLECVQCKELWGHTVLCFSGRDHHEVAGYMDTQPQLRQTFSSD